MPSQLRYTEAEVEQIRTLFPDVDSLKLYRKYLLNLPLSHDEIDRVQALWASQSVRPLIQKVTLPLITGDEAIGVGYDLLHNISLDETNFEYLERRVWLFKNAIHWLQKRIDSLDNVLESNGETSKWLTAAVLSGDVTETTEILGDIVIKKNVEGILVGLNALITMPVETAEEKAARLAADSTN